MAGNSEWNKAVKQAYKMGKKSNSSFSLKEAMFAAKKIYKKGKNATMSIGSMGKQTRRRGSPKKKNNRRRTYRGGSAEVVPANTQSSSMFSNIPGLSTNATTAPPTK